MRLFNFLLVLFFRKISSEYIFSDLIKPLEYCRKKQECIELGFDGEVDCIDCRCACIDNTKYNHHLKGCYRRIEFEHYCDLTVECVTPGAICGHSCDTSGKKKCICKNDDNFVANCCIPIEDKLSIKCCTNKDCNYIENMYCDSNTNKCACKSNLHFYNDTCDSLANLNICRVDDDCAYKPNSICAKIINNPIGKCECKKNFINIKNKCVENLNLNICQVDEECHHIPNSICAKITHNPFGKCECKTNYINIGNNCVKTKHCKDNSQCEKNENCFLINPMYGICYEGLICMTHEIIINNKCVSIKEKLCKNRKECKDDEICYSILQNKTAICIKETDMINIFEDKVPKNMTTDSCTEDIQCRVAFTIYAECKLGKCVCKQGCHPYDNRCFPTVKLEDICTFPQSCLLKTGQIAGCIDGRCSCDINQHSVSDQYGESCENNTRLGEECTNNEQCIVADSMCSNGVCRCRAGYTTSRDQTSCLKETKELLDPCKEDGQCEEISSNAVCEQSVCKCQNHYHAYKGKCYKDVKLNETCSIIEECFICTELEPYLLCKEGRCTCKHKFTSDGLSCTNSASQLFYNSFSIIFIITVIFQL